MRLICRVIFCYFRPFFTHFLPSPRPKNRKNQNFEKMKKILGDIILQKCTENLDHVPHCPWDTVHDRCNSYFSFWAIFCPFTPLATQKLKLKKKYAKTHLEISFYTCVPKIMTTWCMVPEIWWTTDGQMDEWKKWHIEVGAPPKNLISNWRY